jgi:hypothetical protein
MHSSTCMLGGWSTVNDASAQCPERLTLCQVSNRYALSGGDTVGGSTRPVRAFTSVNFLASSQLITLASSQLITVARRPVIPVTRMLKRRSVAAILRSSFLFSCAVGGSRRPYR